MDGAGAQAPDLVSSTYDLFVRKKKSGTLRFLAGWRSRLTHCPPYL